MYGSKIYRSDGKVWMSPSLSPIVFQRKQVVSLSGGTEFNTKISPDRSPIIFVAYSKAVSLIANRIVRNNGDLQFRRSGVATLVPRYTYFRKV